MRRIVWGVLFLLLAAGCQGSLSSKITGKQRQIGGQLVGTQKVFTIAYHDGVEMGLAVAREVFSSAELDYTMQAIGVKNCMYPGGCMEGQITPVILEDYSTRERGVVFKYDFAGVASSDPYKREKHIDLFEDHLEDYVKLHGVPTSTYSHYTQQEGRLVEVAHKDIPRDLDGFVFWLGNREEQHPNEGVYEFSNGKYTIGVFYDENDRVYKYKGMILETRTREWHAGEIKIKFNKIDVGDVCLSRYFRQDKSETGVTWRVFEDGMVAHNLTADGSTVILLPMDTSDMVGSRENEQRRSRRGSTAKTADGREFSILGNGSAWLVSDKYLVTCDHVVDSGNSYFIKVGDDYHEVRVVARDKNLDLAALKLMKGTLDDLEPLPLRKETLLENGSSIFAIGFPVVGALGTLAKITDGIISAQSGYKGKAQDYQISVPIQGGNSGGPVLDEFGGVSGVASAKLVGAEISNVSFMVKYQFLKMFLQTNGVDFTENDKNEAISAREIFRKYGKSVFLLWVLEEHPDSKKDT